MRFLILLFSSSLILCADNHPQTLSLQSFTGLINTPNAQVIPEGTTTFSLNNQFDNHLRNYDYHEPSVNQEDYMIGIGFLSHLEVVARLTETESIQSTAFGIRDLGASLKFQLPFQHTYLPSIAIGLQDVGGASNFYSNNYIVMDKKIAFLRASLGYGKSEDNKVAKRMDGLFGGLEARVSSWASLLAEHDSKENHVALRLNLPKTWSENFQLHALISQNITEPATSIGLNFSIPLGSKSNKQRSSIKSIQTNPTKKKQDLFIEKNQSKKTQLSEDLSPIHHNNTLQNIQEKLANIGFENIQVGRRGKSLYVKCENSIFEHNDLDALGVILGTISQTVREDQHYIVTLLKNNLQTLTVAGYTKIFNAYLQDPNKKTQRRLKKDLQFYRTFDEKGIQFINKEKINSSFFKPRLELSPGIISTVGTEIGLFDYALSLRANAYTTLYDGLTLSARYEIPLTHSKNFDEGEAYGIIYRDKLESRLVTTMLHQTLHYESILNTTSLGRYQENYNGLLNHTNLTTTSGEHGFNLKIGSFSNKDNSNDTRDIYLGSYRYFYAPLDLSAEVMYGQFWNQDQGSMLKLKRFFGDTSISFYLKDTVETYAGFELSLPLTWQKAPNHPLGQIKGKKDFSYGIRTVVKSPSGGNYLAPGGAIVPKSDLELETHYLNRDRLNGSYIGEHLDWMREAYLEYNKI